MKRNKKVQDAITSLVLSHPFFASILLQQKIVENNDIDTFAVNGTHLFYNDKFADSLTFDECKGVLAHEILHIALLHITRKGNRDHSLFNEACDYAINPLLKNEGFKLPEGALDDKRFHDKSAEDIYRILEKERPPSSKNGGKKNKKGNFGEVLQSSTPQKTEEEVRIQVKVAEASARNQGQLSASLVRLCGLQQSQLNWREIINRFVSEQFPRDYSWSKPNKRFLHHGIILPSLDGKMVGKFAIAVDTSGSVSNNELVAMVSEVMGCLETILEDNTTISLPVIYCDAAVCGVQIFETGSEKPEPKGGGGTDFAPIFAHIAENKDGLFDDLRGLIVITDGYCDSHGIEPPFPVIWAITTDQGMQFERPFGEIMKFDIS